MSGGFSDGTIAKFAPDGSLTWATTYGGDGYEQFQAITSDGSGNIYLVGQFQENLPLSAPVNNVPLTGAYSVNFSGFINTYLLSLNSSDAIQWSTFIGGYEITEPTGVAVSNNTSLYVAGYTNNPQGQPNTSGDNDFPLVNLEGGFNQGFLNNDNTNANTRNYDAFISMFDLSIINPLGIKDVANTSLLQIFPNPTGSELNVQIPAGFAYTSANIQVFDALGQMLLNKAINGGTMITFSVNDYAPGVYLVRLVGGSSSWSSKFVKQ